MYNSIIDPNSNQVYSIFSVKGKKLINNYLFPDVFLNK